MNKPHVNLWHPYAQMKHLDFVPKAKTTRGSKIYMENNNILIDGVSSWWTACHGYNHPHIINSMNKQLQEMPHIMFGGFTHAPVERLASRLVKLFNNKYEHIFFVDSGSVAVEVAMKMSIQYWINKGDKNKKRFLCFNNSYHGDTLGAMSVCDPEDSMHNIFSGYLPKQINVDIPDNDLLKNKFKDIIIKNKQNIAAIILEPLVQCAGGFKFHSIETLQFISKIAKDNDILFILDEIATGFGRTGNMFASLDKSVDSDIICLGKALTGGTVSLAATLASKKVYNEFYSDIEEKALMHGPTYMANPLACSAANASLDLFEKEDRLVQVKNIEKKLYDKLFECKHFLGVKDVRVKGAIGVVQVKKMHNLNWLRQEFVNRGVWIRPFLDVIYIMPPFIIKDDELDLLINSIIKVLPEWSKKLNEV